ncbi:hypothetical protein V6N13_049237 [Hibiscus sabdariffa]
MNLKIFCWNAQGCGHPKFLTAIKQYIRDSRPFLLGIVEPRISGARADSVIAALGFHSSHRIEAVGFSGGLWLCWHESLRVEVLVHHFQFMHCRITCLNTGSSSLVTLVYASPSVSKRKILWPHLRSLASSIREPWLLMGDFNATLDASERKGGADAGDRNTAYFHRKAKQRKVRNRITSLQLPDGSWCDDENILRSEAANFFRDLFLDHGHASSTPFPFSGCFPVMPQNVLDSLATAPSFSEASQACYACAYSLGAN